MEDRRFARSLVYLCAHSSEGAMGIILNQLAPQLSFGELLVQLDIIPATEQIRLPALARRMRVHHGGPVETGRGFVLHSADYLQDATLLVDHQVGLTGGVEIEGGVGFADRQDIDGFHRHIFGIPVARIFAQADAVVEPP
jgi:putative transcriptional regulator